jgi:hypothetical protein
MLLCFTFRLTTHSTGLATGLIFIINLNCSPVNSGVRCLSLNARHETKMRNEQYSAFIRGKIVAICEAILNEEISVIAGSRILKSLGYELWDDRDEDFLSFVVIDSETDHLPVDWERGNWSVEALERKDEEIASAEALYKDDAFAACRKLIARFDMKDGI